MASGMVTSSGGAVRGISGNINVSLGSNGLSPPILSTTSSGTQYDLLSAILTSVAGPVAGLESDYKWYMASSPSSGHKWYSDLTNLLTLDENRTLTIKGTTANTVLSVCEATSGVVNLVAPATSTSPTFTLPASLPTQARQVLVSVASGNLSFTIVDASSNYVTISGLKNVANPANVTGFIMSSPQFSISVSVTIINTNSSLSTVSLFQLEGVQLFSNAWTLSQSTTGPFSGVIFSILKSGQI
ncbi:hypothetical protein BDK51DRAFT_39796 [Blyttiomyces helicus]|uniref:Uncharacterized protein n=1 Tax=Blyttiomyces helicus TaxID=388810 RepID=A0A4V1IR43_9FUNG|nr:hypothetical protein BDK51DRAFT_39796 [Blyttiomyces helicus]|eukprot:RKO88757.1 hypothetical protein BDK51DRAFT_39796 [Blyttiomyces helicus]